MNIIVPDYQILNFETESLVISDLGISKVNSQPLLNAIRQIKLSNLITREELEEVLSENGLNVKDAFEFLERIIPLKGVDEIYFEKTIIVHDWEGRSYVESIFRKELSGAVEFQRFSDDVVELARDSRCFIVLLCDFYDYENIKKLYFDLMKISPKSAVSVCWRIGALFCIGQPYIAEIGNPCHFCIVDRLVNNESVIPAKSRWTSILAFCRNKHVSVPSKPLSLYQEMIVIGAIVRKVKFFVEAEGGHKFQDDVLHTSYVQLSDGKIFEEANSHWYMCDCLRADL